jgi:ABC-type sulfate/molybdate transport systems ATPase subunit
MGEAEPQMTQEVAALQAHDIGKVFEDGFAALTGIDLSIGEGEFVTLLGPSGCGKTTLLKTFAGFHAPTTGRIDLGGKDITSAPPEQRDMAMCFQSYALFPHLSVSDNIDFGPRQNRVPKPQRLERLEKLLNQVDLEQHREKLPNKLSGGQQQRVALARALAMRPSVVLFDEPLSNLDAKLRDQVRREIRNLQKEIGFTAVYVTHDQAEALSMSDRVVVMRGGRIDQIGAPEEVYENPRRPSSRISSVRPTCCRSSVAETGRCGRRSAISRDRHAAPGCRATSSGDPRMPNPARRRPGRAVRRGDRTRLSGRLYGACTSASAIRRNSAFTCRMPRCPAMAGSPSACRPSAFAS